VDGKDSEEKNSERGPDNNCCPALVLIKSIPNNLICAKYQMLDAGMRQHAILDGRLALVAATRYMVAQRLRRNVLFSTQNALKLQRGEALNEDA